MPSGLHHMDDITPPGSFLNPPLTPPPTEKKKLSRSAQAVLDCLELHRAGQRPAQPWWRHRLVQDDYTEVLRVLDGDEILRGYVEDKVRLDYDPFRGEQTRSERNPDASFKHEKAKYPGVIIEVCYSQKFRAAADLADDYILDTNGNVKLVIALNIEYRGSKKATLSIWRPEDIIVDGVEELRAIAKVEELPFRTASGHPADESAEEPALQLALRDFGPTSISQEYADLDQIIMISSRQLCDFLSYAEAEYQQEVLDEGIVDPFPPGKRKRRRPQTPPENISSEEELTETMKAIKRGRLARDSFGNRIRGPEI
ncbi:hypothetical protein PDIG_42200 [Penicillium digitatum PHI26]|uniref:Uncharacterized protein n=2 Tax=Penicillium digitatum TaxID=36651 RepID=K9FU10_PEND2|nr:hypothetical protein PDIP_40810 [Penicillium digitatum Pd1]EKV12619.1 hypothetical protein PDIG_42200 [Penicillium digitatum PHI26]EKV15258.1 hypothetical protein PDIP_40810 [Penicillium digitatum Pd1]